MLVLVPAACGDADELSTVGPAPAPTATSTTPAATVPEPAPLADDDLVHPLLAFLTAELQHRPAGAIGIEATNDCLAEAGFVLPDVEVPDDYVGQPLTRGQLLTYRREHGYGFHSEPVSDTAAADVMRSALDARDAFESGLDDAERERFLVALYGPDGPSSEGEMSGGCHGEGDAAVQALSPDAWLPDGLRREMSLRLEAAYAALDQTEYLGCVHDHGFTDVLSMDELAFRVQAGRTTAEEELEIAEADAECGDLHLWPFIAAMEAEVLAWLQAELAGSQN